MVQKRYSLYSDAEILDQQLAVEIGTDHLVLVAGNHNKIAGIEFYELDGVSLDQAIPEIRFSGYLLSHHYSETRVFFQLPESVLVPVGYFNSGIAPSFIDLVFGPRPGYRVNVESINTSPGVVNVYRSDPAWQETIGQHFRAVTRRHLYSHLAENLHVTTSPQVHLRFYKNEFVIAASGNGQLLLLRSFPYNADADVLYHLLNTCNQLGLAIGSVQVTIGGFIEADSPLSRLLAAHFPGMEFETGASLPAGEEDYPPHYFTPFTRLLS